MPDLNQNAHFGKNPSIKMSRSRFPLSHTVKFSGNVGELIPIDCWEVLPGDTFRVQSNKVVRFQTLLSPIMDNMWMDVFYFYAPSRILWDHFKNFFGESERAWYPAVEYSIPVIESDGDHLFQQGSVADYLGIPPETEHLKVNALPFRMYGMIVNEFFRSTALEDPIPVYTGDATKNAAVDNTDLDSYSRGGPCWVAAKKHDVFTSCLPGPQFGPAVRIPGEYVNLQAPVFGSDLFMNEDNLFNDPVKVKNGYRNTQFLTTTSTDSSVAAVSMATAGSAQGGANNRIKLMNLGIDTTNLDYTLTNEGVYKNEVINGTIDQLRMAFQIQKLLYRDGLGGSRYRELLRSHFTVVAPDASLQIPQYLGGNRFPIVVHQIANTGETETAKLGNVGAMSVTTDQHDDFVQSFQEPGYVMCLGVVRYDHTYSQGLHRMWSKKTRYDFYYPEFAALGNQPVYKRELDARFGNYTWTDETDPDNPIVHEGNKVFGFQEAWYDYRYIPDRTSGEMRPGVSNTLASWHLGDYYEEEPYLSPDWLKEDKNNVDRVIAVSSEVANQFWADFYFRVEATRPMPVYSVPGLVDHF